MYTDDQRHRGALQILAVPASLFPVYHARDARLQPPNCRGTILTNDHTSAERRIADEQMGEVVPNNAVSLATYSADVCSERCAGRRWILTEAKR